VQPFSTILFARMGNGVGTIQLMKMVAGVINPGRPVANLYVSCFYLTKFFLAEFDHEKVFHVEPRCYRYFSQSCSRSQNWPVPKNPTSCYVSYPSMGYSYRLVLFLISYFFKKISFLSKNYLQAPLSTMVIHN
jgi:hypothetical protein